MLKLPGDPLKRKKALFKESEVIQYLHSKVEEHVKTLDPNNPRDYIDVFLIGKNNKLKFHPEEENKSHYFTGICVSFVKNFYKRINVLQPCF